MMKTNFCKIIGLLSAGIVVFSLVSSTALAVNNLLINPGAETGDLTGWNESGNDAVIGVWESGTGSDLAGSDAGIHSGDKLFVPSKSFTGPSTAMLYQDVEASSFQVGDVFEASCYAHACEPEPAGQDFCRLYLEFIAPNGDFVYKADGTSEAYWVDYAGTEWERISVTGAMPEGTKWVRVILRGYNKDGGNYANAFFDDVSLINLGQ